MTKTERRENLLEREKVIIESFATKYNSIKRDDDIFGENYASASRSVEYGINPEIEPNNQPRTFKVEISAIEIIHGDERKHRLIYDVDANDAEEAEDIAMNKFSDEHDNGNMFLTSVKFL